MKSIIFKSICIIFVFIFFHYTSNAQTALISKQTKSPTVATNTIVAIKPLSKESKTAIYTTIEGKVKTNNTISNKEVFAVNVLHQLEKIWNEEQYKTKIPAEISFTIDSILQSFNSFNVGYSITPRITWTDAEKIKLIESLKANYTDEENAEFNTVINNYTHRKTFKEFQQYYSQWLGQSDKCELAKHLTSLTSCTSTILSMPPPTITPTTVGTSTIITTTYTVTLTPLTSTTTPTLPSYTITSTCGTLQYQTIKYNKPVGKWTCNDFSLQINEDDSYVVYITSGKRKFKKQYNRKLNIQLNMPVFSYRGEEYYFLNYYADELILKDSKNKIILKRKN